MAVANFELRFPLFGLLGIGKGYYGIFPVDFVAFYDMGLAWDNAHHEALVRVGRGPENPSAARASELRVNVLGLRRPRE